MDLVLGKLTASKPRAKRYKRKRRKYTPRKAKVESSDPAPAAEDLGP